MFNSSEINPEAILSNREFEVMCLIGKGKSLKEIGEQLFISEKTVSTYRSRILEKLKLKNNSELIKYVLVNKLIV
jgi:DNA-binding CsgD family transcriptional regulator